jgi:spermidine synthase
VTRTRLAFGLVVLIVAFSGFTSLVYQVVWERLLRYNFGGDSVSSAVVTATFLLGLGVGAVVFGRRFHRAFAAFALVELAIGAWAMASYHVLAPLGPALAKLASASIAEAEGLRPQVVLACVLFLLPPCILMGGTLPLMFNCFVRSGEYKSSTVGLLYGLNTAGAALGALAAPFLFLNRWAISTTLLVVGAGNVLIAAAIWLFRHGMAPPDQPEGPDAAGAPVRPVGLAAVLALAFVSGFISLSFEISLVRAFFVLNPSSPYNFPAILVVFLLSLALGSILFSRFTTYAPTAALRRVGMLFLLAVLGMQLGIYVRGALALSPLVSDLPQPDTLGFHLLYAGILVVLFPLFLSGVFPLLLKLASHTGAELPRRTGLVYIVNAVGSFSGAMLVQFVGFSLLGTRGVIRTLFLAGVVAGAFCLVRSAGNRRVAAAYGALAVLVGLVTFRVPRDVWDVYRSGIAGRRNVDRVEGVTGVAVIKWAPAGEVFVNGQIMSTLPDHPSHVRLVSFPLSLPRRRDVLLLGLGGGGMVRELLRDPGVERVDVVDWSYELPVLLDRPRVRALLDGALQNPKVRIWRCDARVAVSLLPGGSFDIVIDNLGFPYWVGMTSVKSVSYFREIRRILKPAGVFVNANYDTEGARLPILAGLRETFRVVRPHARVGIVLASDELIVIDRDRAEEVLAWRGKVFGIQDVPQSDWLIGGLRTVSADEVRDVEPIRDDLLVHEYRRDPLRALLWRLRNGVPAPKASSVLAPAPDHS